MKLPDFTGHAGLNTLRNLVWASLNTAYSATTNWDPLRTKLINEGEIDGLDISKLTVAADGTFEYAGLKIVVYIRDQQSKYVEKGYKFHFYNCATIHSFRTEGKYDGKYVANRSGLFTVNLVDFGRLIQKDLKMDLHVCKNCLKEFNYQGYEQKLYPEKQLIYESFTREDYFTFFESRVSSPRDTVTTMPVSVYDENWATISKNARKAAEYKCQDCGKDCKENTWDLHVHHRDHNKGNNAISNLEVLCYNCHAKHHEHMHVH